MKKLLPSVFFMMTLFCLFCTVFGQGIQPPRAIENIAAALRAMGNEETANRLINDFRGGWVRIADLRGDNAETGLGLRDRLQGQARKIDRTTESYKQSNTEERSGNWIKAADGNYPGNALKAGLDTDGSPLYIIRAPHMGGLHVGKLNPSHGKGYIPFGGNEISVREYYVYVGTGSWKRAANGSHPEGAIVGGNEADGTPLYIIRANYNNSLQVGKLNPNHHHALIPFGGKEVFVYDYEVLVDQ